MPLALEIRSGPLAGRTIVVEEGQTLRIGRAKKADLVVAADGQMSGLHCAIEPAEGAYRLRDLGSSNGTYVNGDRAAAVRLREGDRVRAGETSFVVRLVAAVPATAPVFTGAPVIAPAPATAPPAEGGSERGRERSIQRILRDEPQPRYALLDAARDRRVLKLIRSGAYETASLYDGWRGEVLSDYAPYLARLPDGSPLLDALLAEGWGNAWGVYLTSARPFVEVRRHFRRFLMVKDDATDQELYFRFYDPRVLRTFLGCCTPRQAGMLFEDIGAFLLEDRTPETLLRFTAEGGEVKRREMALGA